MRQNNSVNWGTRQQRLVPLLFEKIGDWLEMKLIEKRERDNKKTSRRDALAMAAGYA